MAAKAISSRRSFLGYGYNLVGVVTGAIILAWTLIAIFAPYIIPHPVGDIVDDDYFGPMRQGLWLGSDYLGRDMLSRVLMGARYTVGISLASVSIACFSGVVLGMIAAVTGGWFDTGLSRFLDALNSIPSKLFGLVVVAAVGSSIPVLILTMAVIYIPGAYRFARALAVNVNTMDYMTVARIRGESIPYLIGSEILPNIVRPVLADFGLRFVFIVLLLSGLSFLGLGLQPPLADWGALVRENIGGLPFGAPAVIVPSLAIASLTISVNLLIDNLPQKIRDRGRLSMANLVEVKGLRVEATTDAGRRVEIIKDVNLEVADGEIVALIGESGSGKTTVALSLMGYARPGCCITGGEIVVNGKDMAALTEKQRARIRGTDIAYVPQSAAAAFNPSATIMEQVIEVTRIHALMPPEKARGRAVELFRALSLPNPETIGDRYPHQVSGGQLQRLSAAMALIGDPKLVIFDEPTTALDVTTQIDVLKAFKSVMRAGGIAGVYVSHDLAVVAQIADRIVVLKGGEVQETGTTAAILSAARHPYTRELLAAFDHKPRDAGEKREAEMKPLLRIDNLTAGYGPVGVDGLPRVCAVRSVSLVVEKSRNLGVIGESGCGKSTLARAIAGILPAAKGDVVFDGHRMKRAARDRSREQLREMQIVFQYADTALNPAKPIEDIIGRPLAFYKGLDRRARSKRVDELLDMVRLPRALRYRHPSELSGGQKQRVNFARALAADPKLIICDEITSALDTVVAAAVIELLKELQRELELSYIFISHDLSVVEAICDEIMVMYGGEKVEQVTPDRLKTPTHPYSKLLFSSVPKLDPTWLDGLSRDVELLSQYGHR